MNEVQVATWVSKHFGDRLNTAETDVTLILGTAVLHRTLCITFRSAHGCYGNEGKGL